MNGQAAIVAQITQAAQSVGLDPRIALQVAQQESGLNPNARGAAGEIGLFQLMPETAAALGVNPYDVGQNIQGGVRYLQSLLGRYGGNLAMALAAYNAGETRVNKAIATTGDWFSKIPSSTQGYIASIFKALGIGQTAAPAIPASVAASGNYFVELPAMTDALPQFNWWPLALLGALAIGIYWYVS